MKLEETTRKEEDSIAHNKPAYEFYQRERKLSNMLHFIGMEEGEEHLEWEPELFTMETENGHQPEDRCLKWIK